MNVSLDRCTAALAAIGALGAILVLLRGSAFGAGLTADSAAYVSVARNLLDGQWFTQWNGHAFKDAAPLFPAALAVPGLFGMDAIEAAGCVNAAAFGLTAFAAGAWVRRRTQSRFLAVWAAGACALSLSLAEVAAFAWTESLFVLLACLALFALDRYLDAGGRSFLLAAAVCAALACLTRYVGLSLIVSGLLLLLLPARGPAPRAPLRRAGDAAAFLIVAAAPIGAWMLGSFLAWGSPTGTVWPTPSGFSPLNSLHLAGSELALWTLGPRAVDALEAAVGIDIDGKPSAAGAAALIAAPLALAIGAGAALLRLRRGGAPVRPGAAAAPAAFAAVYALGLAITLVRTDIDLPARFLAPLYVPVLAAASIVLGEFLRHARERRPAVRLALLPGRPVAAGRPALILTACLVLWLAQWIGPNLDDIRSWREHGRGYSSREWAESETVRYLQARRPAGQSWTNEARALYLLADIREGLRELLPALPDDADRWVSWAHAHHGEQDAWLVWFHARSWRRHEFGVAELAALRGWQEAAVLEDGVVLRGDWDRGGETARLDGDALLQAALRGARPAARARFDVYTDGGRLVYVRDACEEGDEAPRFFLHVTPADAADLPGDRRRSGFENLDFDFADHGFRHAGRCIAVRNLPRYGIAGVETGQWTRSGRRIWETEFAPDGPGGR